MNNKKVAYLYAKVSPNESQKERFLKFLRNRYGEDCEIAFEESSDYGNGFCLKVGDDTYNFSEQKLFSELKSKIAELQNRDGDIIPLIKEKIEGFVPETDAEQLGRVSYVADSIATVKGLKDVTFSEILVFESGVAGMVQNITEEEASCILFGDVENVFEGEAVARSKKVAGIGVSSALIGRVIDALGNPIDGKGDIEVKEYRKIERPAPGIIDRSPVNRPIETGILTIDSMFPIGRGQRELIIGDRQTGKTAIAIDTIINQKGKDVICIYVAIGQKASSVSQIASNLEKHGAMDYTVIVSATASVSSSLQYIAPYSGCAIAEYFMDMGKDVLIVYDDLSKHAVAYRSISLLLGRSPGREAYPGDVFYLHSRLLERSAQLSRQNGGGSITALPIVETQNGDISAYIPTNIISITDGQIFLEDDLFFSGQRPAVNVGISVSRVGSDAQTKAMKKATGTLRLDLAQYREMKIFTQFATDLDETTKEQLSYGERLMHLLRQEQYSPYKHYEEIILLCSALSHAFDNTEIENIGESVKSLLEYFESDHKDIIDEIEKNKDLTDSLRKKTAEISNSFLKKEVK